MNRRGKINVQGVLKSDSSRLSNFNYNSFPESPRTVATNSLPSARSSASSSSFNNTGFENQVENVLTTTPINVTNFLYKISGQVDELPDYLNATDAFYIKKLKSLPISRSQSGYDFTINKVIVRGGRKKALVQILPKSQIQNLRDIHKETPNLVELEMLVRKGNDETKCRIVVYYTGVVTVQMGVLGELTVDNTARNLLTQQVNAINQGIIQTYFPFIKGTGKFTNISGQFQFNYGFRAEGLRNTILSLKNITDVKLPEMEAPLVRFIFKYDGVTCMIFPTTGVCQMLGATSLVEFTKVRDYIVSELQIPARGYLMNVQRRAPAKKKKTKLQKAVLCPKSRRPDSKSGQCPKKGYYKRPNEQGDMCCYKVPKKITDQLKSKVVKAYKNANINVPKNVKGTLNIQQVNKQIENDLFDMFSITPNGTIKIKRRMCSSYTKPQLTEFAAKMGMILKPKRLKSQICMDIYQEWRRKYERGGGLNKVDILATGNKGYLGLKIKDKMCKHWTKRNLLKWAEKRQIIINPKLKKLDICRVLFERANANSRFESEMMAKRPVVSIVNGKVLIHDRELNFYSNDYLKTASKKLKINVGNSSNRYDMIRKIQIKYTKKPAISVKKGKLHLLNRNAELYTKQELKQAVDKLPQVDVTNNMSKKQIINAIFLTTNAGRKKQLNNQIKKLSPNRQVVIRNGIKSTFLSPDEILTIFKTFIALKTKVNANVNANQRKKLINIKQQLKNVDKNLNWWKRNNENNNINKLMEMNSIDELKYEKVSLKSKLRRLRKKDVDHDKQTMVINQLYKLLSKKQGFQSKYTRIAKMNNQTSGAVSLAKQNIHYIVAKLLSIRNNTNK